MRKVKNAALILLALLLTAAGGLLPMGAARMQDGLTANTVQYGDIEALQLKLEEAALSMSYMEKLLLIRQGTGMEIDDENTRLKESQVLEAVYAGLMPYMELFLGGSIDNDHIEYYPVAVYDEADPSRYACYWYVSMSLDTSFEDVLTVVLDDETGTVLAVDLIDPEMHIEETYLEKLQYTLADIYFTQLDMYPSAQWPIAAEAEEYLATGRSLVAAGCLFTDPAYGEVGVQIGVRTDGFYIYLA